MTRSARTILIASISICACTDAEGPATTGSYELEVTAVTDTCDPARPTGAFRAGVFRVADALSLDVPVEGMGMQKIVVTSADAPVEATLGLPGCTAGTYERTFRVTAETPTRVDATLVERWRDLAGCPADAVTPRASCEAERQLVYELALACEPPCALVSDGADVTCQCEPS